MFRSKIFWGSVLGVMTSVLIFEGRVNLGSSSLWNRVSGVLAVPGAHFANAVFSSGVPHWIWENFWSMLATTCNLMVYALVWCVFLWTASYFRERRHPYDRQSTLVPRKIGPPSAIEAEPGPFDLRYFQ